MKYVLIIKNIRPLEIEKRLHVCLLTNVFEKREVPLPQGRVAIEQSKVSIERNKVCFWDHGLFSGDTVPIPVRIVFPQSQSLITKSSTYCITVRKSTLDTSERLIVVGDGEFCSYQCALAFAYANHHNTLYRDSVSLLKYLYSKQYHEELLPAPDWRALVEYGGHMNLTQFRSSSVRTMVTSYTQSIPLFVHMKVVSY